MNEMDASELDDRIAGLEGLASSAENRHGRWKEVWDAIRDVSESFKSTRYPTREGRDAAWKRFQGIVQSIKAAQATSRAEFESRAHRSSYIADFLMDDARKAFPYERGLLDAVLFDPLESAVGAAIDAATFGVLKGKYDERKQELKARSDLLRSCWRRFTEHKGDMLGRDKARVFSRLREAQEALDRAWEAWRSENQRLFDARQDSFRSRVRHNIEKLEERLGRLYSVLEHKERHVSELRDKRDSAWNDDFRSRVEGWIDEEESAIDDIRAKVRQVEGWLEEERGKL